MTYTSKLSGEFQNMYILPDHTALALRPVCSKSITPGESHAGLMRLCLAIVMQGLMILVVGPQNIE